MKQIALKGPEAYTPEWYEIRKFNPERSRPVVFGASEAAAACNVSPYSSALQLYLEKRGEFEQAFSDEATKRVNIGRRLEPLILDCYEEEADCILDRNLPLLFHPAFQFMAATPDAIAYQHDEEWSVDAKATSFRMIDRTGDDHEKFGEPGTDQIPLSYLFQAQQQMAVINADRCDFPVLVDGRDLLIYTVKRNDELIEQIASAERELAERIIAGDPPEPNWSHAGTSKLLQSLYGWDVGKNAMLCEADHSLWIRSEQLKEAKKRIEDELDEIRGKLLWSMQDSAVGSFPDADYELRRTVIGESYWTEQDVAEAVANIGQVKRAGYVRLTAKKLKRDH